MHSYVGGATKTIYTALEMEMWIDLGSGSGNETAYSGSNCSFSVPPRSPVFVLSLQIIVGIVCVLSILGSALILFTFIYFRDLRTTTRHFLANLSVADSIIAASHLVGLFANYKRFLCKETHDFDALCTVQAGVSMFSTLAAFSWTLALAVQLCFIVVFKRRASTWSILVTYLICWGIPLLLVIGYGSAGYLGFDEGVDIGWCYLKRINYSNGSRNPFPNLAAYELWTYIIFVLLPLLYIWVQCYIKIKIKTSSFFTDVKLIFIPILFLLLRVWSFILDTIIVFNTETTEHFNESTTAAVFILMAGVGNSAQGIANAVLFIGFTKVVRRRLTNLLYCRKCCDKHSWTMLHETNQMPVTTGSQPLVVTAEEKDNDDKSSLDGSLEALRVLQFQSSTSSYGTT